MISHRHTRGTVLDLNSEVCPESYLEDTKVAEQADVYQSQLKRSWVDTSKVIRSSAEDCDIRGTEMFLSTGDASNIYDSKLYDTHVLYSTLTGVQARGAVIHGCTLEGDIQIGKAELIGITIKKPMRIGVGFWDRVPRSFELKNDLVNLIVTESTDGHAYVGCQRKPISTWIKGKERFRKVMGWDHETVDTITGHFEEWLKEI